MPVHRRTNLRRPRADPAQRRGRDLPGEAIEKVASRTYNLARERGGGVPYTIIREISENLIHSGFSEVVVTILDDGNTVRFADQGPGIADKERVFLPGFSTATSEMKRHIKGVGSGLPIVRECLSFAGGTVEIDDNLGRGAVVTLKVTPRPKVTESPLMVPCFSSASRFWPLTSEAALPVSLFPSVWKVNRYFCTPICESNSARHWPAISAAREAAASSPTRAMRITMPVFFIGVSVWGELNR